MSQFDFIDCATRAFGYVWQQRRVIARLCGAVLLFKVMSFLAIILLDMDEQRLRQGLVLLPSYFMEGWVIAYVMAGAVAAQNPRAMVVIDRRLTLASAIIYTLIKLVLSLAMSTAMSGPDVAGASTEQGAGSVGAFGLAALLVVAMVWCFRYLWMYIPVALGFGLSGFFARFNKFSISLPMIGLWVLCFVPFAIGLLLCLEVIRMVFHPVASEAPSLVYLSAMAVAQAIFDFGVSLVSSVGMAYGIVAAMNGAGPRAKPPM